MRNTRMEKENMGLKILVICSETVVVHKWQEEEVRFLIVQVFILLNLKAAMAYQPNEQSINSCFLTHEQKASPPINQPRSHSCFLVLLMPKFLALQNTTAS